MEELKFQIKANPRTDGLRIYPKRLVIDQRMGKDEKVIPIEEITEIGTNKSMYDMPFMEKSLSIVAQGKKYVLRRLSKGNADKAKDFIINSIPLERIRGGYVSIK